MKSAISQDHSAQHNQRDRKLNWGWIALFRHFRESSDAYSLTQDAGQNQSQSKETSEDVLKTVVAVSIASFH